MSARQGLWTRAYRLALRALPTPFRSRHAGELERLVRDRLDEAGRGATRVRATALVWKRATIELADVLQVGVRLRLDARRRRVATARSTLLAAPPPPRGLPMRTALRSLRRRPGFAALAGFTLALGVGASTAIFAVADALLLRPLPYPASERLVMLWRVIPALGFDRAPTSLPDYLDFREQVPAFSSLAAYANSAGILQTSDGVERIHGARVTGNLFRTLGTVAALGRVIGDDDDRMEAERVIVLADGLWRRRFGADSSILGRTLVLNDAPFVVVGIMPPGFEFPTQQAQFWAPMLMDPATAERDANFITVVGRLGEQETIESATAQVTAVAAGLAAAYPGMNDGYRMRLERRHEFVVAPVRPVLRLLLAAAGVLLAIALANLTNLQLVRDVGRRRERAVRRALGATVSRLAREQVAESTWIALGAAVLGIGLAYWLTELLLRLGPALPRGSEIAIDGRAMLVGGAIALGGALTGSLVGLAAQRRQRAADALVSGSRGSTSRGAHRAQEGLVVAQLALALTLFVGAGLLGRSFVELVSVPRGFEGEQVLTAKLSLPGSRYPADRVQRFYDELLDRLALLPGVQSASGTWALPFSDDWASSTMVPAERPSLEDPPQVSMSPVRPRFFETVGMPLRAGRDFTPADRAGTPAVAIVNETLARMFWPGASALGRTLHAADSDDDDPPLTVVGVVGDIKRRGLARPTEPEVYLPHAQSAWARGDFYVTLRADGDPHALARPLRRVVADLDPLVPITDLATLDALVEASLVAPRFRSVLVGCFAAVAGALALIGIYGVLIFAVGQRRHEIAVRAALGATPRRVRAETLRRGARLAMAGACLGLIASAGAAPLVGTLLFEVEPFDAITYAVGVTLLASIAVLGSWLPARRAARIDPMLTLREEG